ncbi:hypothetical protein G6O67_006991 [Ophiocordyceps sinensis]|uniref:Uncharacterized protein n=2 Tax=Ophiocordyceps sinensis TaxID=72228 RepID=A0A8H4LU80_9HYPO|nr:hypothetical protein OCS_00609 [Ophiocordyceps sinensis CO18]KAF4504992.1 hypothetical protein G6O67_006991 [Ophiocordyceps sinensis]
MMLPAQNASSTAHADPVDTRPTNAGIDNSTIVGIIFGLLATGAGVLGLVIAWRQMRLTAVMSRTPSRGGSVDDDASMTTLSGH